MVVSGCGSPENEEHPNIILILTNDQDVESISHMPKLQSLLVEQGMTFENAFVTNPLCCPSRATILRGQYSHNHGVLTNQPPIGGFEKFRDSGSEKSTVATWLHSANYRTVYIGKYLNGKPRGYEAPGWDEFSVSGYAKTDVYSTDWFADEASGFIKRMKGEREPFFMHLSTKTPHKPAIPAPRHENAFPGIRAPRPPSFNEKDVSDKPEWIRERPSFSPETIAEIDELHRKRLQSLLAVDEMIGRLISDLRAIGELDNTYIFFSSDHGWSQGEHRRNVGKGAAYEEDIRVPLIVRGPGVPAGQTREHLVLNNDFAPTFADLAGVPAPEFVDGHSLTPLLTDDPPSATDWRSAFLVEGYASEKAVHRPPYRAVRTTDRLYVEYDTGERELYDMRADPYQLESQHETADPEFIAHLEEQLDELLDCAGESCRTAEGFVE